MKTCEACGESRDDVYSITCCKEENQDLDRARACIACQSKGFVKLSAAIRANRAAKARSEEPGSHWLCGCYRGPDKLKDYSCGLNTCDRTAGDRLAAETRTMQSGPENTATYVTKRHGTTAPPGPAPYELFRAAVEQHLVPLLPKGFRAVTDNANKRGQGVVLLWILDDRGAQLTSAQWDSSIVGHGFRPLWQKLADEALLGWAQLRTGMKEVPRKAKVRP